ncbi:hypothetical protein B0J11DRAFT_204613 [Dendryphion nanum]|uniref:Uncharacterized protein n=1 Tax=Dendryphion nanum TaxID=256645 RepID=A0A9P9D0Q9_9PLEO|nr:hypothetical protein B0J11DRAFT_204613 [Dendryphion nanum]
MRSFCDTTSIQIQPHLCLSHRHWLLITAQVVHIWTVLLSLLFWLALRPWAQSHSRTSLMDIWNTVSGSGLRQHLICCSTNRWLICGETAHFRSATGDKRPHASKRTVSYHDEGFRIFEFNPPLASFHGSESPHVNHSQRSSHWTTIRLNTLYMLLMRPVSRSCALPSDSTPLCSMHCFGRMHAPQL